jgi:O-succinylbenzoate synthase
MFSIDDCQLTPFKIKLRRPFAMSRAEIVQREGVYITLTSRQGATGAGEAAPLEGVSAESLGGVMHQLQCLAREWVGRSLPDSAPHLLDRLEKDIDRSLTYPSVVFALESAVLSLAANIQHVSAAEFLGASEVNDVKTAGLIQGDIKTVAADGARYLQQGFNVYKLKVGSRNIPLDVRKVDVLRDIIGPGGRIRLDANGTWSLDEALTFAAQIGKSQIEFIEEPCRDEQGYEKFFLRTDIPWAVEAHRLNVQLPDLEGARGFNALIVKPMLTGGITGFLSLLRMARGMGVRVIVSSAFESPVGLRMLAACGALTGQTCGLGTADWLEDPDGLIRPGGIIQVAERVLS